MLTRVTDKFILAAANVALYANHRHAIRRYRAHVTRWPNLANPQRYADMMLWRKLIDHNPLFVTLTDKLGVRDYSRCLCPEIALPEVLWVGNDADAIPANLLCGNVFVKTNHSYNTNYKITDGHVDRKHLKQTTDAWLAAVHGRTANQWAYSQVPPKLFIEASVDNGSADLIDFKIRASNGRLSLATAIGKKGTPQEWKVNMDPDGTPVPGPWDAEHLPVPSLPPGVHVEPALGQALDYARRLSAGIDYARFDFLWNGDTLYGGEITIYPASGFEIPNRHVHDAIVQAWDLRDSHFLQSAHRGWRRHYAAALGRAIAARRSSSH